MLNLFNDAPSTFIFLPGYLLHAEQEAGTNELWGTGKLRRMNAGEQEGDE
jgi:hypothetical protein